MKYQEDEVIFGEISFSLQEIKDLQEGKILHQKLFAIHREDFEGKAIVFKVSLDSSQPEVIL